MSNLLHLTDENFEAEVKSASAMIIDFWATWCGPCKAAMKTVIPVKEELWDKCHFVYVTGTTSPKALWNTTIPDIHGDHFYVTEQQWSTLLEQFQAQGIPTYVVVDSKGQVQKRFIGFPGVEEMRAELPEGVETVFISSVAQMGLTQLKDVLWRTINDERNRIPESIVQRDLDERHRVQAEDDFIFSAEKEEVIEIDDDEAPDAGGKMIGPDSKEWSDEYWETDYQDENDDFQVVSDPDEEQVF